MTTASRLEIAGDAVSLEQCFGDVAKSTMNIRIRAGCIALVIVAEATLGAARGQDNADQLVRSLRTFPAGVPGTARSDGKPDPTEERRRQVYTEMRELDQEALGALVRGLADPDVELRRNVALFLHTAAGTWYDGSQEE